MTIDTNSNPSNDDIQTAEDVENAETSPPAPEEAVSEVDPLETLRAENAELKDKFLRAVAEADNARKRADKQSADARVYAIEKFAGDILSVADNLARALKALNDEARVDLSEAGKSLLAGIEMTEKELYTVMARHGVTAIDAAPGATFDPNVHEAVTQIPSDQPEGTVAEPFQTGWRIGERTLRAALVAVSAGPAK
ncbi:MAG: nucleotide exchange factor GrpE [Pseudomonadota bacterium]